MGATPRRHAARLVGGAADLYPGRREWEQYSFDPSEKPKAGHRSWERTAISDTEEGVVREMARCLREIRNPRRTGAEMDLTTPALPRPDERKSRYGPARK